MLKKKVILSTIAILLVMVVAVSVISYSIATKGHGDGKKSNNIAQSALTNVGDAMSGMEYVSNIDLILENARDEGATFNIVEIAPNGVTANDAGLKAYCDAEEGFGKYVLYENRESFEGNMPANLVKYDMLTVSPDTELTDTYKSGTVQDLLDNADLIYLNSPQYDSFNGMNNMSEAIYNYLHVYALGKDKPFIMNFVTTASANVTKTYGGLVNEISRNHIRFRTFEWKTDVTAGDFFTAKDSYYLKYMVNSLPERASGKVLVISGSDNGGTMYQKMSEYNELINTAYYGYADKKPEKMTYTFWNANNRLTLDVLNEQYDFILIEGGITDKPLEGDVYEKFKALSESSKYIIYDSKAKGAASSGEIVATENNYLKLLELLVNPNGVEKYSNVLPISVGFFTSLNMQGAEGVAGAKAIADLLNGGDYRGSNASGANGKKFRVLELQPCYPIDLEVAATKPDMTNSQIKTLFDLKGNYYEQPSEVLAGVTKDEVEEGTEYYAFELSKAKIAHATGLKMDQIQVDQMSTDELISHKELLLEAYDLIYVGGNNSALTPYSMTTFGSYQGKADIQEMLKVFTVFDMYTHTGISVPLLIDKSNNRFVVTNNMPYGNVDDTRGSTYVELNGNDITYRKLEEFRAYMNAGMPIIFERKVTDAFNDVYKEKNRLKQLALHKIDPDSFMYDLLTEAYLDSSKKPNIIWGVDATSDSSLVQIDNSERVYGNTLGDVTVFEEKVAGLVNTAVLSSQTRPSLTLTKSPKEYIEGNPSSYNTDGILSVTGYSTLPGAENANITMRLYVDYNGDGIFSEDEDELVDVQEYMYNAAAESPEEITLAYKAMEEDFFGIINWKVVASAPTGSCAVTTGYAYYPRKEDADKKEVRILQIMPVPQQTIGENEDENDGHSLYLCTECQLAEYRATYNIWCDGLDNFAKNTTGDVENESGVNLGLHEHKFGIVKFDSTIMDEDWESNLADALMEDYEFQLDIITISEFEEIAKQVAVQTEDDVNANIALAEKYYAEYETLQADLENSIEVTKLETEMREFIDDPNVAMSGQIEEFIQNKEYYKFWLYNLHTRNSSKWGELANAYNAYIAKKDAAVEAYNNYLYYTRLSGNEATWMLNNFDIVVLGFAEDFGGRDFSDDLVAIRQLQSYIDAGGSMLNTHDSTTRYKGAGATNLTNELRSRFGMDRFHVSGTYAEATFTAPIQDNNSGSQTVTADIRTAQKGTNAIRLSTQWSYQSFDISNQDLDVTIVANGDLSLKQVTVNPVEGSEHISIADDLNINVTVVDNDGKPISGTDVYILDRADYNASVVTSQKTDADGKITLQIPQAYSSNLYNGSVSLYKSDIECDMVLNNDGSASVNVITEGEPKVTGAELTTIFNVKDADGNPVADDTVITLAGVSAATKDGKATLNITPTVSSRNLIARINLTNKDVEYNMSMKADGSGELTLVEQKEPVGDTISVTLNVTDAEGQPLADGVLVTCNYGGTTYTASVTAGKVTFTGLAQFAVAGNTKYKKYMTEDPNLYFWTERAVNGDSTTLESPVGYAKYGMRSVVGVTDPLAMYSTGENHTSPYAYAQYEFQNAVFWNQGYTVTKGKGTDGASQVNKGIVTTYPFAISSELRISGTHSQTLALDMEDDELAVWYTLSAGSQASTKAGSSVYAASPKDGMDNYYLYSKGGIFYCGAGHTNVTGPDRDNNDERRLFINIIVNSVRNKGAKPKITIHEPDTEGLPITRDKESGTIFLDTNNNYYYKTDDNQAIPEFDFKVKVDSKSTLRQVYVYYDLNYDNVDGDYSNDFNKNYDVMIAEYNTTSTDKDIYSGLLNADQLAEVRYDPDETDPAKIGNKYLQLKPEYFAPYANRYTYIVIKAIDSSGKVGYQRIKINLTPTLFDLTDATFDNQNVSFRYKFVIDMSDRVKYNI